MTTPTRLARATRVFNQFAAACDRIAAILRAHNDATPPVPSTDALIGMAREVAGVQDACVHDSTRVDGTLGDHCLRCGVGGYWHEGLRHDVAHVSGGTLIVLAPAPGPDQPRRERAPLCPCGCEQGIEHTCQTPPAAQEDHRGR